LNSPTPSFPASPGTAPLTSAQEGRRQRYDEAFRREALLRWRRSGRSAESVAKELGISLPTLYYWSKVGRADRANQSPPPDLFAALKSENELLRADNDKLQRQKQILRRAVEIMAENPKASSAAP